MDILDEIIELLKEEKKKNEYLYISPEIMDEFNSAFFSQIYEPKISVQQQQNFCNRENTFPNKNLPKPLEKTQNTQSTNSISNIDFSRIEFEQLREYAKNCKMCPLHQERTNTVFGEGSPNSKLMFILDEPGIEEDKNSIPLCGDSKELLDKMIEAMGFAKNDVFITNTVKCHPANGGELSLTEVKTCIQYINRQIELIKPKAIIIMGSVPLKYLLNGTKISNERGKWHEYKEIKVMPTFHPAFLLRQPSKKKEVWSDLKEVMKYLKTVT